MTTRVYGISDQQRAQAIKHLRLLPSQSFQIPTMSTVHLQKNPLLLTFQNQMGDRTLPANYIAPSNPHSKRPAEEEDPVEQYFNIHKVCTANSLVELQRSHVTTLEAQSRLECLPTCLLLHDTGSIIGWSNKFADLSTINSSLYNQKERRIKQSSKTKVERHPVHRKISDFQAIRTLGQSVI